MEIESLAKNFIDFLNANSHWVILAGFASVAMNVGWRAYSRRRDEMRNPTPPESAALFEEKGVSGLSRRDFFTRIGGAKNALVVRVTKELLIIEPLPIFKWLTPKGFNDLEHRIPRSRIRNVEVKEAFMSEGVSIEFFLEEGTTRTIELSLKNLGGFLRAMNLPGKT